MAGLAGYTLDEVEDIRLVVSEICIALIEHGAGASIELSLTTTDKGFFTRGSTVCADFDPTHPDLVLSRMVLDSASPEHGIESIDGTAVMWAVVARRLPS
jgi:anti-sigma regulatory factor (Ser/Thr protein kinase)